jgi:spore maturation protein CgeB
MATFLYYGDFQHFGYCENWIADALDRNGHHCLRIQRRREFKEEPVIEIANKYGADYLLISKAPEVQPENLRSLRAHTRMKVALWSFDWMAHPQNWEWFMPLATEADISFQTDGTDADKFYAFHGINRVELHQGCVPGLHGLPRADFRPIRYGLSTYGVDLAFIGSSYTQRRQSLFDELARYKGFRKWGEPGHQLWGNEFAAVCHLSKIVIGDNFVNNVPGYWSDRVYLTLACGGFFLAAYVPGLENEFENHRHLVWWHDFEGLHKLIEYYLPREAERRAIAVEGQRLVHREHTYDRRIQRMTEELEKL